MTKVLTRFLIFFMLAVAGAVGAAAQPGAAAGAPQARRAELLLELFAGPTLGMDRALRGGKAGIAVGVASGRLSAAARAAASYDASLGCFFAECGLSLGLGGGARLLVGGEMPLGAAALEAGGSSVPLRSAGWPCLFAISVPIARIARGEGRRAGLIAEAELSYSAYRVESSAGAPAEAAGLAGFQAGFRAFLCARLSLGAKRP